MVTVTQHVRDVAFIYVVYAAVADSVTNQYPVMPHINASTICHIQPRQAAGGQGVTV